MDHKAEAERLAGIIHDQVGNRPMSAADTIALAQVHATLHLADRLDQMIKIVSLWP